MNWTENYIKSLLLEMIEENPIGSQALLKILEVRFTNEVETLAVTISKNPELLINLSFLCQNCYEENHVKAVILHEFLHVLLNHTEKFQGNNFELNIALDAVINSIIHRMFGSDYSDMFKIYYKDADGIIKLLKPYNPNERKKFLSVIWKKIYNGKLAADDILEIVNQLKKSHSLNLPGEKGFIGNHTDNKKCDKSKGAAVKVNKAIKDALKGMTGVGIWNKPKTRGVGIILYKKESPIINEVNHKWRKKTLNIMKKCLIKDQNTNKHKEINTLLPILNEKDRRGFLRILWNPLIGDITWTSSKITHGEKTQVYLDVSGSMNVELDTIVALLHSLYSYIKKPIWAFSNKVYPAVIKDHKLQTRSTGGTSIECVFNHIYKTKPGRCIIVSDGYIESITEAMLKKIKKQKDFTIMM